MGGLAFQRLAVYIWKDSKTTVPPIEIPVEIPIEIHMERKDSKPTENRNAVLFT